MFEVLDCCVSTTAAQRHRFVLWCRVDVSFSRSVSLSLSFSLSRALSLSRSLSLSFSLCRTLYVSVSLSLTNFLSLSRTNFLSLSGDARRQHGEESNHRVHSTPSPQDVPGAFLGDHALASHERCHGGSHSILNLMSYSTVNLTFLP